jgi:hypothetical protein
MNADFWRQSRSCSALFFCFAAILPTYAGEVERYRFQEGEPLTYKTHVAVVVDSARESKYFEHFSKSHGKTKVTFDLDYQLLPIAHEQWWKVRLVLDQVKRTIDRDGSVETATFDRDKLKSLGLSAGDMLNQNVWELGLSSEGQSEDEPEHLAEPAKSSSPTAKIDATEKVRVPEDLFDRPILTWFAADGTLQGFEDRTELQEITEGLDLKECIKLLIPPLPSEHLKPGVSWSRNEPVDLPEPPLKGEKYEPPKWDVTYTIKSVDRIGDSLCARIALRGRFARDGLWIPIAQEIRKYLVWKTMITKLEESIEGELLYDIDQKVTRASTVKNTYNYSTVQARKVDNYRGKILMNTSMQAQVTSALIEQTPMEATADPEKPAVADASSAASNEPDVQILTSRTLNKTAEKHRQQQ